MNATHLHLMLVHIPILFVPLGALFLILNLKLHNKTLLRTATGIFLLASLTIVPAFLLGESAEEAVEDVPGVSEAQIEEHEESAEPALWLTCALGLASIAGLIISRKKPEITKQMSVSILALALITSLSLAYAAQEGGKIRHPEAFGKISKAGDSHRHDD